MSIPLCFEVRGVSCVAHDGVPCGAHVDPQLVRSARQRVQLNQRARDACTTTEKRCAVAEDLGMRHTWPALQWVCASSVVGFMHAGRTVAHTGLAGVPGICL